MKKRTFRQFLIFLMIIIFSFTLCGCTATDLAGEVIETMRSGRDKDDDKEKRVSRRKKNDGEEEDAEADEDENGNKDGESKDNADEDIDADANDSEAEYSVDHSAEDTYEEERSADDEAPAAYEEEPRDAYAEPDYIIYDSDSRKLTDYDLSGLNAWELRIARNEIYARHGRMFKDKELQDYFDGKSWYYGYISPSQWSEKNLNQYEAYNVNLISKYEKNAPAPDASASSGYTNNELCQMALNYYSRHYGYRPGIAEVDSVNGNMVTLHLYDDMGTHTATSAWYEIDRTTGKGTDEIMGGKVDLNR